VSRRADRIVALIAGGLLSLILVSCSAVQVAGWSVGSVERTANRVISGPVDQLRVDAGGGDVTLLPALGDDITIDSRTKGSLHAPRVGVEVHGTDVSIDGGCSEFSFGTCAAEIVLHVPAGTAVRVDSASGDIVASGLSGNAELRTASGDVTVRALGGRVELESASGDIQAGDLRAHTIRAQTASGDVDLSFLDAPDTAEGDTASGDVRIAVPRGPEVYRVEIDTDSGDPEFGVNPDPSSRRLLRATTSSGDASVGYTR
jgi:DUF4097 and DUF4098 domain-containing protein YvlB